MASPMCIQSTFCSKSNLDLFFEGGSGRCTSMNCKNFLLQALISPVVQTPAPIQNESGQGAEHSVKGGRTNS